MGSRRERKIGICGVVNMKKKILKAVLGILICWGIFVAIEGFRLIGSTDPGKCPLITLGSTQTADEIADYGSLGFSQTYHLTNGDAFVYRLYAKPWYDDDQCTVFFRFSADTCTGRISAC